MEKKAHIYYNKENALPDRTTRGDLQMMRMLKIMFIILVGIGMLVMGIYEFIRLKKRRRKLKQLLDNIASGSTVDQLLKENHPKLSAMDEMEKYIYIIIGFGAGLILFGAFFMTEELMERNVIPDMTGTTGWMLVQRLVAFASGIILLFTGNGMKKKQVKENDYMDIMIPGKVVGEVPGAKTLTPGKAILTIQYTDPYDDSVHNYQLAQELSRKKHLVGSEYPLYYSREQRKVYDPGSNKVNRKTELFLKWLGILICLVSVVSMLTAF